MKIAILTIRDDDNYGNRLQNYATQIILEMNGNKVFTLNRRYNLKKMSFTRKFKLRIKKYAIIFLNLINFKDNNRRYNFYLFNKKINFYNKDLLYKKNFRYFNSKFDYFVIGSDQIWNPNSYKGEFSINFLPGVEERKKFALSPSIATNSIDREDIEIFKENLKNFKALSCRENEGSELIKKLTNRDCETLIDPTLVLESSDWDKIIIKPKFLNFNEYILVYNLGDLSDISISYIDKISKVMKIRVIYLNKNNKLNWSCGPSEFVYLIKNAKVVITDSFHGSIFSIIYDRPLKILERTDVKTMSSRLDNLKELFSYHDLLIDNIKINYSKDRLENEKIKFKNYLTDNLN